MATHSSILAWDTTWTERGAWWATVHGVGHDWSNLALMVSAPSG